MCGIAGILNIKAQTKELRDKALKMAQKIRHRGPDWSGIYVGGSAILAHERLSIVDPQSGGQPLYSPDRKQVLAVNGEIYNHREIRTRYAGKYDFQTGSDLIEEREFPQLNSLIIGVDIDRELRREKITRRLKQRLDDGMVEEVRRLLAEGIQPDDLIYYGLEYKYLTLYAIGKMTYDEMFTGLETAIHQFAKRQMTWFRGMERRGFTIHWVDASLPMEEKINFVKQKLKEF